MLGMRRRARHVERPVYLPELFIAAGIRDTDEEYPRPGVVHASPLVHQFTERATRCYEVALEEEKKKKKKKKEEKERRKGVRKNCLGRWHEKRRKGEKKREEKVSGRIVWVGGTGSWLGVSFDSTTPHIFLGTPTHPRPMMTRE